MMLHEATLALSPVRAAPLRVAEADDAELVLEGRLLAFTDEQAPDLLGDFFTRDTDLGALTDTGQVVVSAYWDHGQDPTIGLERLGTATLTLDDEGVWARYVIRRRRAYLERVLELLGRERLERGLELGLGQSSGALAHTLELVPVSSTARWIRRWDLGEASLTPTPAEPSTWVRLARRSIAPPPGASVSDLALRLALLEAATR